MIAAAGARTSAGTIATQTERDGQRNLPGTESFGRIADLRRLEIARIGQRRHQGDGAEPPESMRGDQGGGGDRQRQARQGGDLEREREAERERPIGAEPAVLHDGEPRLARASAERVGDIGKTVLVQRSGDQDAGRDRQQGRQRPAAR